MPSVRRSRTLAAAPQQIWEVVSDPHHLPRWWPRVDRVEAVEGEEFTELLRTSKGKAVRADFRVSAREEGRRLVWSQLVEGTPFARVLASAEIEIELAPAAGAATEVAVELRQRLRGVFPNRALMVPWFGALIVRRAALSTVEEALENLERIFG